MTYSVLEARVRHPVHVAVYTRPWLLKECGTEHDSDVLDGHGVIGLVLRDPVAVLVSISVTS